MKILIAVDSTEAAPDIARTAESLFPNAEYVVMSAASVAPFVMTDPLGGGAFATAPSTDAFSASEDLADDAVESAQRALSEEAEHHVELGAPGPVICEQASLMAVDVIVVGHRSKNWLSRLVEPSVSDYVVRHAPCPVLVIREQPEREQTDAVMSDPAPEPVIATD